MNSNGVNIYKYIFRFQITDNGSNILDSGYMETIDVTQVDGETERLYINKMSFDNSSVAVEKLQNSNSLMSESSTSSPISFPSAINKLARVARGSKDNAANKWVGYNSPAPSPSNVSNTSSKYYMFHIWTLW